AESVEPDRRGTAFGIHRAADHAGAVLGPLLATGILLLAPGRVRLVFALAAVPAALSVLLLVWKVREGRPATALTPEEVGGGAGGSSAAALHPGGGAGGTSAASVHPGAGAAGASATASHPGAGTGDLPLLPHDPADGGSPGGAGPGGAGSGLPRSFRAYLAAMAVFTLGNASDAFLLLRAEQVGVPVATLPLLWGAFHVSKMLWSVP